MQPKGGEVMRRAECDDDGSKLLDTSSAPLHTWTTENKEMLRQQLLANKDRDTEKSKLLKPKHARNRQKNRWKLKFHHQALPQEYLDHYEQSLQKANCKRAEQKTHENCKTNTDFEMNNSENKSLKIWAQRFANTENKTGTRTVPQTSTLLNIANKSQKIDIKNKSPAITPSKIVTYDDLPYMGEMTLSNLKPRRGRKPKKADICHLIYENYGTIVPGQPLPTVLAQKQHHQTNMCPLFQTNKPVSTPKTHLQNKIITNLLERQSLQENNMRLEIPTSLRTNIGIDSVPKVQGAMHGEDEPLNLCIRDLNDLKIQIKRKINNIYATKPEVKTEIDTNNPEHENIKTEQLNEISVIHLSTNLPRTPARNSSDNMPRQQKNMSQVSSELASSAANVDFDGELPSYLYCSDAGIHLQPLVLQAQLLYYQRLAATSKLFLQDENQNQVILAPINVTENDSTEPRSSSVDKSKNMLVLKPTSDLLDSTISKRVEDVKFSPDHSKMKRTSPNPVQGPVKRKRSAIFMPPMPIKGDSTTPTTEVSICKFKFTGGSKPSLQEKNMLSVDSGGNYTYYSGTANKGSKGYEYMLKDSDQRRNPKPVIETFVHSTLPKMEGQGSSLTKDELSKKKRKSRKSLQREKLEQTFKEKGFLIQTQQHQSAEGATYCKFRQLRKFTRYLFRSWKDYLPGGLNGKKCKGTPTE